MQQPTHVTPDQGSAPLDSVFGRRVALATVRTSAACMAGWSLYVVARHYGVPGGLALSAGLVFDGVAYLALRMATDAMRAGRSAAAPIAATLAMAGVSVYLNLVHARFTGGGRPAEVLYASPAVALLLVSVLSWGAERAAARAARGETPMRLPAFGILGWTLAREKAMAALKTQAAEHVTSSASPAHQAASPRQRTAHAVLSEKFAAMDPADAIEIAASSHPQLGAADLAQLLAAYGVTVDALEVALVLGQAAAPSVTLNRMPSPGPATGPAALTKGLATSDTPLSEAILSIHRHLPGDASAKTVVQELALQGRATDTAYVRTTLSRAKAKAIQEAAQEAVLRADAQRSNGTGFYP
jgi:hypothetical protein